MQFHTTPILAAVEMDKLSTDAAIPPGTALIVFAIALAASVLGNWLASLVVAKHRATIGRAFLTLAAEFLYAFGIAIAAVVLGIFLGAAKADGDVVLIAGLLALAFFVVVFVMIPMRIYDIGALRSIGFIILSGLIGGAIQGGAQLALFGPIDYQKLTSQVERYVGDKFKRQSGKAPESEIFERQAALRQRYEQLEIRRKYLPANDRKALADYERDRAKYEQDVEDFKADTGQ
jgi:hypothetical protein